MARIEPFKGLRPAKNLAEKVASPPYDVINSREAKELAAGNDYSFLHIVKPEIDLEDGVNLYSDAVYNKASENFKRFIEEGTLVQDEEKHFYVYKQVWGAHEQIGLVAGASAQDYEDDVIKKHEFTREEKEKDRMRHIETLDANTGPVFLTFRHRDDIDALFAKAMDKAPEYDFDSGDGVRHIFWVIEDEDLNSEIREAFKSVDYLYVADGHHRSASGTNVKIKRQKANADHTGNEEYNFFLSVIFPDNQMKILAYNRVLKTMNGNTKEELFKKIEENFEISETDKKAPESNLAFSMYMDKKWYMLKVKDGSYNKEDAVKRLDASILQDNVLNPIFGIENPRTSNDIDFVGGIRGTEELEKRVDSGECYLAFSLYPTTIEQLFDVADSGKTMPPKSTWFEPKLRSGLITHLLKD